MEHLLQLFHPLIKHSRSVFVALSCGCPRVLSSLSNSSLMSTTLLHVTCRRNKKQCFGHAKKKSRASGKWRRYFSCNCAEGSPAARTRRGLSYLLNGDPGQLGRLKFGKRLQHHEGNITKTVVWMLRLCLQQIKKAINYNFDGHMCVYRTFLRDDGTWGENF